MPWKNSMIQCQSSIVTNIVPYPPEGAAHLRWKLKMWSTVHPHRASSSHLDRGGFTPTGCNVIILTFPSLNGTAVPPAHKDMQLDQSVGGQRTCWLPSVAVIRVGTQVSTFKNTSAIVVSFCTCMLSVVYTLFHLLLPLVQKHRPDSCFLGATSPDL